MLRKAYLFWGDARAEPLSEETNYRLRDFAAAQGAGFADFPSEAEFANLNTPDDVARAVRDAL